MKILPDGSLEATSNPIGEVSPDTKSVSANGGGVPVAGGAGTGVGATGVPDAGGFPEGGPLPFEEPFVLPAQPPAASKNKMRQVITHVRFRITTLNDGGRLASILKL